MTDIPWPLSGDASDWPKKVEGLAQELNLTITLCGTLKSFPGSIHWHMKQGKAQGVLEVTVHKDRAWISVQDGRKGEWIEDAIKKMLALG